MKIVRDMDVAHKNHVQFGAKLTEVPVSDELPSPEEIEDELLEYCNVLLGRSDPPI